MAHKIANMPKPIGKIKTSKDEIYHNNHTIPKVLDEAAKPTTNNSRVIHKEDNAIMIEEIMACSVIIVRGTIMNF